MLLRTRGLVKDYAEVRALDDVSIEVDAGEVLGLVGENGAGKSTLVKAIAGFHAPDSGEIVWDGEVVAHHTPIQAVKAGIEIIPQELSLARELSAAENMFIGHVPSRAGMLRRGEMLRRGRELAARVGLEADVRQPVSRLSPADQRLVMIARALARSARLLILDEPTVTLQESDVHRLLDIVRRLRAEGVALIYISHRLEEILEVTDRTTVMRDGRVVGTEPTSGLDKRRIMNAIVGRELGDMFPDRPPVANDAVVLEVEGLSGGGVDDVSFSIASGEILGLAGLVGSGRTEVARRIFGADPRDAGTIRVAGEAIDPRGPKEAIGAGIALLPEDRRNEGALLEMSVAANVTLPSLRRFAFGRTAVRRRAERIAVRRYVEDLRVATPSTHIPIGHLSGGNQQKALIGKWLMTEARVLIFDEPTVGIDVGAKREIYELIARLAGEGAAVLLISTELEEIVGLCHRVIVMREGRAVGELRAPDVSEEAILRLCFADSDEDAERAANTSDEDLVSP
jgi:ABC-type sugar transport system ATPase subunit